jgi:hypothetical protein
MGKEHGGWAGGCLFVVLKDALVLYVRWRMTRNYRGRRIMNFDRLRREHVLRDWGWI